MQNSQLKFLITCFLIFFSIFSNAQTIRLTSSPQYVRVGDLDVTGNKITVEALVKFTGGVNIVSKHTGPPNVNYLMRIGTFEITTTNQFYLMSNPYAGSMQTNTWYHVAGTYDGSFVRYYVNGCLIVQLAATGNIITNNLITGIGNISSAPNGEQFYGEIDELRIWNVARTAAQLSANMFDLPNPTTQTGLLGYWKFDGNLTNLQGNTTYNGTWVGTPDYGTQPLSSVIPTFGIQSVSPINATCYDAANGSIAVTASGTNVNYSIDGTNWGTSNTFSNLDAGNYTVYARTQEGCVQSQASVVISEPAQVTANASNTGPYCPGASISLQGSSSTSGVTYAWTGPGGFTSSLQNPTNATAAGVYQLITSLNGCSSPAASTTVVLNSVPTASATNTGPYCAGDAITLQGASTTAGVTYAWTGPAGFTSSVQNPTNATSAGIYQLITSLNGCSSTIASTTVIVNPTPTVNASNTGAYCVGDPISLQANSSTAGANFVWSGPNGFSSTVQNPLNASEAGAYQVIAIANGCSSLPASTTVIVNPIPTANASNSGPFCQGSQGTLVGQATPATNAIYNWTGPNGFTSSQQNPSVTLGGTYSLLVTVNGCSSTSSSTTLVFSPTFSVTASNSGPYYPGESVVLFSSANIPGTYTYLWESDGVSVSTQANPTFPALNQNGEYIVTYTDANGCSATDTTLVLYTLLPEVSVPNVFTPNNDGSNDLFFFDLKGIANVQCQIFNRWGNLIYELNGVNPVWNGKTKNNELVSTGVYFYKLEAIDLLGKKMLKQGNIHILY